MNPRRLWPRKLRSRLTLWYTAFCALLLLILGATSVLLLDRGLRDNVDASLLAVARVAAESARRPARPGASLEDTLESFFGPALAERFFQLLDPLGRPDPRLPNRRADLPLDLLALRNAALGNETYETVRMPGVAGQMRLLTYPVVVRGRVANLVQVAMPLDSVERARSRFLLILLGLTPLALGGAAAGGWFLARRALAPVDAMVDAARRIEAEDLARRIETTGNQDELDRLAGVLNDMLGRLESSFAAVRQFSADAAHELRTPLTILKGEIEVALHTPRSPEDYRHVLGSALEEVNRLATLVEDLLFLARAEAGTDGLALVPVDLAQVLDDVAPALHALADAGGVGFGVAPAQTLWVSGNAPMLFRLIFNLGENAVKYTTPGGDVRLALEREGDEARLDVLDTGDGIAPEDQPRIFDRFYRADPARTRGGTGLGLALARSIAVLHRGRISVESSPGRGTRFSVRLPLALAGAA
ncbi:MAG TPA: ATP-binding protein [Candidatus Bathyarchaeia archaeon]|nr:ATP-binding protein [Candidatus Bathyarchaeia archaeon]